MKDLSLSFIGTATIQLVTIVSGILLARLLLPDGRGALAAVILWPSLVASFGAMGLFDAVAYRAARREEDPGVLLATSMALAAALAMPLAIIGWAIVPFAYGRFGPDIVSAAYLYVAFIPLTLLATTAVSFFQGKRCMVEWNIARISLHAVNTLGIVVVAAFGARSVWTFALVSLIANVAVIAFAGMAANRRGWLAVDVRRGTARSLLQYGAKVHLGAALALATQRLDQAAIALWLAASQFGFFVVALSYAGGTHLIANTVAQVVFPKIAEQQTDEGRAIVLGRYLRATMILFLPAASLLFVLAPWLIALLFGDAFAASVPVTRILILAALFYSARLLLAAALRAWNQPLAVARAELAALVTLGIALAVLLPTLGLAGAAWAAVAVNIVAVAALAASLRHHSGLTLRTLLTPEAEDWRIVVRFVRSPSQ